MKQIKRKVSKILLLLTLVCSCSSTKNITGVYRSNFAEYGFFITNLELRSDSTFEYKMHGDVLNDIAKGSYKVAHKRLLLKYDKPVLQTTGYVRTSPIDSVLLQTEVFGDRGPRVYYVGYKKMFVADSIGNKKSRASGYSNQKRFLFWGDNYLLMKRYFLDKIE